VYRKGQDYDTRLLPGMKLDLKPITPVELIKLNDQEIKIRKAKKNNYKYLFAVQPCLPASL
jgi:hypothetical protein